MKLPKLYRVVTIKFWSIRLGCTDNLCVEEVDVQVERKARRVLCDDGWRWQLLDDDSLFYLFSDNDEISLYEHELNEVEILN